MPFLKRKEKTFKSVMKSDRRRNKLRRKKCALNHEPLGMFVPDPGPPGTSAPAPAPPPSMSARGPGPRRTIASLPPTPGLPGMSAPAPGPPWNVCYNSKPPRNIRFRSRSPGTVKPTPGPQGTFGPVPGPTGTSAPGPTPETSLTKPFQIVIALSVKLIVANAPQISVTLCHQHCRNL